MNRAAARRFKLSDIEERDGRARARPYAGSEAAIQSGVLEALRRHPKVAWARRINSGFVMLDGERPFRAGFVGCSDIIGQLTLTWGGRFVAVEVKSASGTLTEAQEVFLEAVRAAGGVAFVARSVDDVFKEIPL